MKMNSVVYSFFVNIVYDEYMEKLRVGHTVSFVYKDITLYGTIEKIEQREDEFVYTIYANGKLYKNIQRNYILNDFGVLYE